MQPLPLTRVPKCSPLDVQLFVRHSADRMGATMSEAQLATRTLAASGCDTVEEAQRILCKPALRCGDAAAAAAAAGGAMIGLVEEVLRGGGGGEGRPAGCLLLWPRSRHPHAGVADVAAKACSTLYDIAFIGTGAEACHNFPPGPRILCTTPAVLPRGPRLFLPPPPMASRGAPKALGSAEEELAHLQHCTAACLAYSEAHVYRHCYIAGACMAWTCPPRPSRATATPARQGI